MFRVSCPPRRFFDFGFRAFLTACVLCGFHLPARLSSAQAPPAAENEIARLLRDGRLEEALRAAQRDYQARPDDPAARDELLRLHMALLRQTMDDQQYAAADRIASAMLAIDPTHAEAGRIRGLLADARRSVAARIDEARRNIRLEWFEPAYETLSQAMALLPERRGEWLDDLLRAAEGAGDDHYFCKNFDRAFFFFDAVLHSGREAPPGLKRRWLQSMVFSLADSIDAADYPEEFWRKTVTAAELVAAQRSDPLLAALRGLANEDLGDAQRAAANYAEATGQAVTGRDAAAIRAARQRAIAKARRQYDESLSPRRGGFWARHDPGDWQRIERERFVIHHRNAEAGRRAADALEYHFARVSEFLGRTADDTPWPARCDVYLHRDASAVRAATRQQGAVRGVSIIRLADGKLLEHEIHLAQDDPLLLAGSIPHELTHLIFAAVTGYRATPAVINEGLALLVEPRCRAEQFARMLRTQRAARPAEALFAVRDLHPAEQRLFYGEAMRLVGVLLSRGTARDLVEACRQAPDAAGIVRRFGFDNLDALTAAYSSGTNSTSMRKPPATDASSSKVSSSSPAH